jgi:hypothetical protein
VPGHDGGGRELLDGLERGDPALRPVPFDSARYRCTSP